MLSKLKKISSAANLGKGSVSGQMATLLVLVMAGLLIFVLTTINIGQVAGNSSKLSNAADSAALLLASQLATKSHYIYKSLGDKWEICKKGGMLHIVLAIVIAIIVIVVASYLAPAIFAVLGPTFATAATATAPAALTTIGAISAGAAGGFVGGAIGGGIVSGTVGGTVMGAAQGAAIGASIGYGYAGMAGLQSGTTTTIGSSGMMEGIGSAISGSNVASVGGGMSTLTIPTYVGTGAAVMGGLSTGASIYNAAVAEQNVSSAMSRISKALNGLPTETERFRESAFLRGLSLTVDDPNTTKEMDYCQETMEGWPAELDKKEFKCKERFDPDDIDGDGDIEERIPWFLYWWDRRIDVLKKGFSLDKLKGIIDRFLNGPLEKFKKAAESQYALPTENSTGCGSCQGESRTMKFFSYGFCTFRFSIAGETGDFRIYTSNRKSKDAKVEGSAGEADLTFQYNHDNRLGSACGTITYNNTGSSYCVKIYIHDGWGDDFSASGSATLSGSAPGGLTGALYRKDIEGAGKDDAKDGAVVKLVRGLETAGHDVSFWEPGPSKEELEEWLNRDAECETCDSAPNGYDELDGMVDELKGFVDDANTLQKSNKDHTGPDLDFLASTWDSWVPDFYDGEAVRDDEGKVIEVKHIGDGDYYATLDEMVQGSSSGILGLEGWNTELTNIRYRLPQCEYNGGEITNSPCKDDSKGLTYGSIDSNIANEFGPAIQAIDNLIKNIEIFRPSLPKLYYDLVSILPPELADFGGTNPVTYDWADSRCPAKKDQDEIQKKCPTDDQGNILADDKDCKVIREKCHSIQVETYFLLPKTKKTKSGNFLKNKKCIKLYYGCAVSGKHCQSPWLSITRRDAANQPMGALGALNPQTEDGKFTITRKSYPGFGPKKVPYIYKRDNKVVE